MKASADRVLYLARVVLKGLKDSRNLQLKSDEETVRRAVVRELTDAFSELEKLEEKVKDALSKRRSVTEKDREFQFARAMEDELKRHGA